MMNECGLNTVTQGGQDRSSITVNNQSPVSVVNGLRKQNGQGATVIVDPTTGQSMLNMLPQDIKDKYFYYSWGYNIHGINISKKIASAQDTASGGTPDTRAGKAPQSPNPPTSADKPPTALTPANDKSITPDTGGQNGGSSEPNIDSKNPTIGYNPRGEH
jgi:hypothetical protein